MTSVGTLGSSQLESWMVSQLFGAASKSQNSAQAATLTSTPSATSLFSAKATVSSATTQAVTTLTTGGSDLSTTKANPPGSDQPMSLSQSREHLDTIRAMTTNQISDAMYGGGLPSFYNGDHPNNTFGDLMATMVDTTAWKTEVANDTSFSDSVRKDVAADIAPETARNEALQAAYDNHTLVFQKASDVDGLDFSSTDVITGSDPNKPPSGETYTESLNHDFLTKSTNHSLINYGGVSMYLTW